MFHTTMKYNYTGLEQHWGEYMSELGELTRNS